MSYELTFDQIQRCKRVFDNNKSNPLNDRDDKINFILKKKKL